MFFEQTLEDKIDGNEQKIKQIEQQIDSLREETEKWFEELEVTPAQLEGYLKDASHFVPEDWEHIQKELAKMEDTVERSVAGVRDPKTCADKHAERSAIQPQWLYVK